MNEKFFLHGPKETQLFDTVNAQTQSTLYSSAIIKDALLTFVSREHLKDTRPPSFPPLVPLLETVFNPLAQC